MRGLWTNDDCGRYTGSSTMYHRKYWLVQTLLKATNANVWASKVVGKSFLARTKGIRTVASRSCGKKARLSIAGSHDAVAVVIVLLEAPPVAAAADDR